MSNTQESKVQLEYISKCTDLVKEKYDRQPCFFIQNAGCQMNSLQTDTVAGIVKRMGYKEVEKEFLILFDKLRKILESEKTE